MHRPRLTLLLALLCPALGSAADRLDESAARAPAASPAQTPASAGISAPAVPRWLEEVRAQRKALQEQRRARQEARRRAIDPVGEAQRQAREREFQQRRLERRRMIAQDRWLFLNFGPWTGQPDGQPGTDPMPAPAAKNSESAAKEPLDTEAAVPEGQAADRSTPRQTPESPHWNNGWYFRGW